MNIQHTKQTTTKKRIKAPISFNEELHQQTLEYWKVSQAWNGRVKSGYTIGDAIRITNDLMQHLNPNRPLSQCIAVMQEGLIKYGAKKSKLKPNPKNKPVSAVTVL